MLQPAINRPGLLTYPPIRGNPINRLTLVLTCIVSGNYYLG